MLLISLREGRLETETLDTLVELYQAFGVLSQQGMIVEHGGFTQLGEQRPMGFAGLAYLDAGLFQFIHEGARGALIGVFLEEEELRAAMSLGVSKIMAVLGELNRFYPTPAWTRFRCDPALFRAIEAQSVLGQLPKLPLGQSSALLVQASATLTLEVSPQDRQKLIEILKQSAPERLSVCLLSSFSRSADGHLVWVPHQPQPNAIVPEGSGGGAPLGLVPLRCSGAGGGHLEADRGRDLSAAHGRDA